MEPQTSEEKVMGEAPETKAEAKASGDEKVAGDIADFKTLAVVGYILPFLFFLPLQDEKSKNVAYVRFHANQQLILLILCVGSYFIQGILFSVLFALGMIVVQLINLALVALAIIGAIGAYKGEMKELSFVGHFRLLK